MMKIGLGKREFCAGLTFVTLSRATVIQVSCLIILNLGGQALDEGRLDFIQRYHNI
jgi:hypothetical protein